MREISMNVGKRQMKLAAFMLGNSNYHIGGWRLDSAFADCGSNIHRWVELARKMEAAKFDMLFIADMLGVYEREHEEVFARSTHGERLEPITTLAAIAMVTKHLGL